MKLDTLALFEPVAAVAVDDDEDVFLRTDEICGLELLCAVDDDDDELDTFKGDVENEPFTSFSLDVVSCGALGFGDMILVCRFLVSLAYC